MKFVPDTISKPVVGKEAAKLMKALKEGGHLANTTALETIARIAKRYLAPTRQTYQPASGWRRQPPVSA